MSRRQFVSAGSAVLGGAPILTACVQASDPEGYEAVAASLWRSGPRGGLDGAALTQELIRCATLAPSSHNTQCWKFSVTAEAITILADLARRCPAVDPDDHHVFITLGCAAENLVQAALAHGRVATPGFDAARERVRVTLATTTAQAPPLFDAIPTWLGDLAFGWFFTPTGENDKIARQVRNSAGIAVFAGEVADKAHWVDVGRAYERFALQATALGVRNAFLNQPVEVSALRSPFAQALGLAGLRPDLVVRFGRGPTLPRSLRRPVASVMV